jgi:low temperature requirement protein LtrA
LHSGRKEWALGAVLTMLVTFLGSIAMWWMYFDIQQQGRGPT